MILGLGLAVQAQEPSGPAVPSQDTPAAATAPSSAPAPTATERIHVIEAGPIDFASLLERLEHPDYVILRGAEYDKLRGAAQGPARGPAGPPPWVVESIAIGGDVRDALARLAFTFQVQVIEEGPVWVPVRLDGLVIASAREADQDRPMRSTASGGWEVELTGGGAHTLRIEALRPVREEVTGATLECLLPLAASARLDLHIDEAVGNADLGPGQPVEAKLEDEGRGGTRLSAGFSARERLVLRWSRRNDRRDDSQTVLSAQGEIALEIHRGTFQTRSSWSIQCDRGSARAIEIALTDPQDELQSIEINDQSVPIEGLRDPRSGLVTIPIAEPLRPGARRRLVMTTHRAIAAGVTTRFRFQGFPVRHATVQSGRVAIVQGADLWVSGHVGRGLRQIDPRELSDALRVRPSTVLAYDFVEQPFDLELRVDPSPPGVIAEARTNVLFQPGLVRSTLTADYRVHRGRLQEVRLSIPDGSELETVGPSDVVESYQLLEEDPSESRARDRVLVARLQPKPSTSGEFRLVVTTRQPLTSASPLEVGLARVQGAMIRDRWIGVLATRELAVELMDDPDRRRFFAADAGGSSGRLPRATAAGASFRFALRTDAGSDHLPVRVSNLGLSVEHQTTLRAVLDRGGWDLSQTTLCQVRDGTLRTIDVSVPRSWTGMWELDDSGWGPQSAIVVSCDRLTPESADAVPRYRLTLDREVADGLELRFHTRLPAPANTADRAFDAELDWIRPARGIAQKTRVEAAADAGVVLEPKSEGWSPGPEDANPPESPPTRLVWGRHEAAPPRIRAIFPEPVELPRLVISRLWVRTTAFPEGSTQTSAWLRVDSHPGGITFRLPEKAQLLQARVGGAATEVDRLPDGTGYRIRLNPSGRVQVLGLEYSVPRGASESAKWGAPRFDQGEFIQNTVWEVRLPWDRALIGVPTGWTDLNHWKWDHWLWKRHPLRDPAALAAWIEGLPAATTSANPVTASELTGSDQHAYLFGRVGSVPDLGPLIWPRWAMVGVCSGLVLAVGVGGLLIRSPARVLVILVGAMLIAAVAALHPDAVLQLAESGLIGAVLVLVAALIQRTIERRQASVSVFSNASNFGAPPPVTPGSSRRVALAAGSEESTVVRNRNSSTADFIPSAAGPLAGVAADSDEPQP